MPKRGKKSKKERNQSRAQGMGFKPSFVDWGNRENKSDFPLTREDEITLAKERAAARKKRRAKKPRGKKISDVACDKAHRGNKKYERDYNHALQYEEMIRAGFDPFERERMLIKFQQICHGLRLSFKSVSKNGKTDYYFSLRDSKTEATISESIPARFFIPFLKEYEKLNHANSMRRADAALEKAGVYAIPLDTDYPKGKPEKKILTRSEKIMERAKELAKERIAKKQQTSST